MAAPNYQLTMRSGPTPGKSYPLDQEEVRLGRDLGNDIPISDPEVSRHHARFIQREENIFLEDLGSTNGTFLNGDRITSPQQLRVGDVITFGENIVMRFEKPMVEPEATVVTTPEPSTVQQGPLEPETFQPPPEPAVYQQPQPEAAVQPPQTPAPMPGEEKKGGLPTWLIILIVAIAVLACVIAVTLYFMPASWWCAITFDLLQGCPVP